MDEGREREAIRREIEAAFRRLADRDLGWAAETYCVEHGLTVRGELDPSGRPLEAASRCAGLNPLITELVWRFFPGFQWKQVVAVYDGTHGQAHGYARARVRLTAALAASGLRALPEDGALPEEVETAAREAGRRLHELWREWAGFKATTSERLERALE